MTNKHLFSAMLLGAAIVIGPTALTAPALRGDELATYLGAEPTLFDTPDAAVQPSRTPWQRATSRRLPSFSASTPAKLEKADGIADTIQQISDATAQGISVEEEEDQRILDLGRQLWPFPFPLVKGEDGKWAFDTVAGLEEIVNRRIGENELQAIDTARLFVQAQQDYAAEDRDGDGVLEFAQKLVSTEGQTDGLYWPAEQGDGDSPVGASINLGALEKAKAGDGYFGYKFRILKRQGDNVAGGAYDYDHERQHDWRLRAHRMAGQICRNRRQHLRRQPGWSGVRKGLRRRLENIVAGIKTFNPNDSWSIVED